MIAFMGKCPECGNITDNIEGPIENTEADYFYRGILICSKEEEDGCGREGYTDLVTVFFAPGDDVDKQVNKLLSEKPQPKKGVERC